MTGGGDRPARRPSRLWRHAGALASTGTLAVLVAVLEAGRKWV